MITLPDMKENPLINDFFNLLDPIKGKERILNKISQFEARPDYLSDWYSFSKIGNDVYPSQGLITTPYDYLSYSSLHMLPQETMIEALRVRFFFLELFNHPIRIKALEEVENIKFSPPPKVSIPPLENAIKQGLSLSIGDLGASVVGSEKNRISRRRMLSDGPFIKLGKHARSLFVGSSSPDVWNSAASIATLAASHSLAVIPRNGITNEVKRQSDLAKEVFLWIDKISDQILVGRPDKKKVTSYWKRNVVGTLEASKNKALIRADALFKSGVRAFRIYSPEPGKEANETTAILRNKYGNDIEIFTSFVINVKQASDAQKEGADGVYIGIGGGGRCITGVRGGLAIDWPTLLYQLRGEIDIPVIVDGGASDHIALTLLLGASGISVSRSVSGGTIESPGGVLFFTDSEGNLYKPYGGEASPRTKYLDGKLLPFDIASFVEGGTTRAYVLQGEHKYPTLTNNLHLLNEDAILSMVFRGVNNIYELHKLDPCPINRITSSGDFQRNLH